MKNLSIVKPAILACSAGLLLTACHTERHERHAGYSSTSGSYQDDSWMRGSGAEASSSQQYSSSSQNYSDSAPQSYSSDSQSQSYSSDQASSQSSQSLQGQNEIVIPLHEEQLNVGKRTVDAGQVTIRKIVKTETVSEPVQLRREMLVIDRDSAGAQSSASFSSTEHDANWQKGTANLDQSEQPASASETERDTSARASVESSANEPAGASRQSASSGSDLSSGTAFQEQTYTIRLQKEEPVIQKNVIQTGRVVARKDSQSQQQTIQQQVRSEDVQLDKSGANVEIRGNFESAGKPVSEPSGAERHDQIQNKSESQSLKSSHSESIQRDSSGAQAPDTGVDKSTDSTTRNRAPTQGQGAQDPR